MENGNTIRWIHLPKVGSTNSYLRQMADDDTSDITVAYTDDQYAGRGQKGNSWECEPGKNLSFSILLHPLFVKPAEQFIISQAMALAVVNVLNGLDDTGKKLFTVKWPNDIYYDDWKISGTLIECDLQGKHIANCIIGTGLNVNQQEFLSDAPNPTSLIRIFGHEFSREQLLHSIKIRRACAEIQRTLNLIIPDTPAAVKRLNIKCFFSPAVFRRNCRRHKHT